MGIEPTQNPFPKRDQGGADLSIANTYHVLYHWFCCHIQGLQLQVSKNLNKPHTLWWNSVPEDVELLPVHQDLSEDKAEGIKSHLGSSIFFAGKFILATNTSQPKAEQSGHRGSQKGYK